MSTRDAVRRGIPTPLDLNGGWTRTLFQQLQAIVCQRELLASTRPLLRSHASAYGGLTSIERVPIRDIRSRSSSPAPTHRRRYSEPSRRRGNDESDIPAREHITPFCRRPSHTIGVRSEDLPSLRTAHLGTWRRVDVRSTRSLAAVAAPIPLPLTPPLAAHDSPWRDNIRNREVG
jgi:hypothetical protein